MAKHNRHECVLPVKEKQTQQSFSNLSISAGYHHLYSHEFFLKLHSASSSCGLSTLDMDDRISNLPEELRNKIVSLLPMEQAIRTSILSKKWRKVSSSLSSLQFNQLDFQQTKKCSEENFRDFVYHTLSHHDESDIKNLSLSLFYPNDDVVGPHVGEWISIAVAHNLCKLNLSSFQSYKMLPSSFFTCKTLTELKMSGIYLNLPPVITFPNLKSLELSRCRFNDNIEANKLFSSCPGLQRMNICNCYFEHINNNIIITISNPNLKYLRLSSVRPETQITSAALKQLIFLCEYNSTIINLGVLPSISVATFCISTSTLIPYSPTVSLHSTRHVPTSRRASKILMDLTNVEKLTLRGAFIEFLSREKDLFARLPKSCCSLKHMYLNMYPTKNQVQVIVFLLHSYPNLETLHINIERKWDVRYKLKMEDYWQTKEFSSEDIFMQLRTVEIKYFDGSEEELEFVRYLLENAHAMEKMNLEGVRNPTHVSERIEKIFKASSYATVSISHEISEDRENFRSFFLRDLP